MSVPSFVPLTTHTPGGRRQRFDPELVAVVRIIVVMATLSILLYMIG